ncbi:MAG: hypothetical protein NC343_07445 [Muribaculum sp.]|nr:hypothetical protein [Muribaculaceae bacterium]MCM1081568.1 hypothetical protein [Muribaculum sp.]
MEARTSHRTHQTPASWPFEIANNMKSHRFLLLIITLLTVVSATAQKLTVVEAAQAMEPMTVPMQRLDANNEICALVKVVLPKRDVQFEGNVVGEPIFKTNEYWVYLTPGTKMLKIKAPDFYPLMVNFPDLSLGALAPKTIYYLTLEPVEGKLSAATTGHQDVKESGIPNITTSQQPINNQPQVSNPISQNKEEISIVELLNDFPFGLLNTQENLQTMTPDELLAATEKANLKAIKQIDKDGNIWSVEYKPNTLINGYSIGLLGVYFYQNKVTDIQYILKSSEKKSDLIKLLEINGGYKQISRNKIRGITFSDKDKYLYNSAKNIYLKYDMLKLKYSFFYYLTLKIPIENN